jgi:hypothetical protein
MYDALTKPIQNYIHLILVGLATGGDFLWMRSFHKLKNLLRLLVSKIPILSCKD